MTTMPDQATALRRLARDATSAGNSPATAARPSDADPTTAGIRLTRTRLPVGRRATVIAVTSGKGGVGKSNVSVNLAVRLAAGGKRVLLVDADLGLANADVLCGVEVPFNLSHVVAGRRSLREAVVKVPVGEGRAFELVGGASGLSKMADLDERGRGALLEALAEVEREADVILVDTGAGISGNVLSFCRSADHVLVVTTPEPTAVTDAYAMVKVLGLGDRAAGGVERKLSLLVNQASSGTEGRAVYEKVAKVARQYLQLNLLDAGFVLSDEAVTRAVRGRRPLVLAFPDSPASRCLTQLAMRLEQGVSPDNSASFFSRFWRKVKRRG